MHGTAGPFSCEQTDLRDSGLTIEASFLRD